MKSFGNPFTHIFAAPVAPPPANNNPADNITTFNLTEEELAFVHAIDSQVFASQEAYTIGLRSVAEIYEKSTARISQLRQRFLNGVIAARLPGGTINDHNVSIDLGERMVLIEPQKKEISSQSSSQVLKEVKSTFDAALGGSPKPAKKGKMATKDKVDELMEKLKSLKGEHPIPDAAMVSAISSGLGVTSQPAALAFLQDLFGPTPLDPIKYADSNPASSMIKNMRAIILMYCSDNHIDPTKYLEPKYKGKLIDVALDCFAVPQEVLEALKAKGHEIPEGIMGQTPGSFLRKFLIETIDTAFP